MRKPEQTTHNERRGAPVSSNCQLILNQCRILIWKFESTKVVEVRMDLFWSGLPEESQTLCLWVTIRSNTGQRL